MSNPITRFFQEAMEPHESIRSNMEDRVGENAVLTQKLKDEKRQPWHDYKWWQNSTRREGFQHFIIAHSSLKCSPGGYRSSTKSMDYYLDKAADRKAALLAAARAEEQQIKE